MFCHGRWPAMAVIKIQQRGVVVRQPFNLTKRTVLCDTASLGSADSRQVSGE